MSSEQEDREARIREIVDAAPPLTPEQLDKLAALFRPVVRDR